MKVSAITRPFEATSIRKRVSDWERTLYGANAALDDIEIARARSQDASRNNPWIVSALRIAVAHEVGCGIQPRPMIPDKGLREKILALWNQWIKEADADGAHHFYSWQALIARAERESGEVFVRLRPRRVEDGLSVPLQVQALEADLLPIHHNTMNGGNKVRQGIELTPYGKRVAYWFYPEHPNDRWRQQTNELTRVPASDVVHHYNPQRPGQLRGVPTPVSVLYRARNLDQFESAELTRKKNKAKFQGAIYRESPDNLPIGDTPSVIEDGREIIDIEEGYLLQLAFNEKIELYGGDTGNVGALDFIRTHLRAIAAGMGVPVELMTGDYAGANDRLMRVTLNAFYRDLETAQERLINQVLQPIWNAWLDAAVFAGAIALPRYFDDKRIWQKCEWRAHAWSYVNPLQEVQTAILKINAGLTSRSAVIAESGWDAEEIDQQQAADKQREKQLGLEFSGQMKATDSYQNQQQDNSQDNVP